GLDPRGGGAGGRRAPHAPVAVRGARLRVSDAVGRCRERRFGGAHRPDRRDQADRAWTSGRIPPPGIRPVERDRAGTRRIGPGPVEMSAPAAVLSGLVLPQNRTGEDRWYTWSMDHPAWLIPPPLVGSFRYFTSPCRGSAETPFHPDSESQEDREGPQLTSSERAVAGSSCGRRLSRPAPCQARGDAVSARSGERRRAGEARTGAP